MTRFLYLSDTHLGGETALFHHQPPYPWHLPELVALLRGWCREHGPVDFLLHGGDLIHLTDDTFIARAADLFGSLGMPVHLCLGNHDLTSPDARRRWLAGAPCFFPGGATDYSLEFADCLLHVVPTQWGDTPYCWEEEQRAHFLPAQLDRLQSALNRHPERLHILCTHAPGRAVSSAQTGFAKPFHPSGDDYMALLDGLGAAHPHLRLVLSAHSHLNMHLHDGGVHYVSCSSFVETPFEFKLVEVDGACLRVSTHNLLDRVSFDAVYDWERTYVQGRPVDRGFEDPAPAVR